jgi:phosphoglycolate phosphatase
MVLFDIDGTLLETGGAGRAAFVRGLERATGEADALDYVSFAGNTDRRVLDQVMAVRGVHFSRRDVRRIYECVEQELRAALRDNPVREIPGAGKFLAHLDSAKAVLGLVTGNVRTCAYAKLAALGFDPFFRFGGFGDRHPDRADILREALEEARRGGWAAEDHGLCLVGDTPFDVAAGKALGMPVVGVASGRFGREDLLDAGADVAVDHFEDADPLHDWMSKNLK